MTIKNSLKAQGLKEYLGSRDLTESLRLTKELSFHWANWDQTCFAQRLHYESFNNNFHLIRMSQELNKLKEKPIWLCSKVKNIKTNLFSLYESYLDSRLRLTWFERKEEILYSCQGEQGPYYPLTSMSWLDKEVFSHFVMRKILIDQYTLRSFRLNARIPASFKLDNDIETYSDKLEIHQLSEFGVIFKIVDKNFLHKIKNSTILELLIPVNPYKQIDTMTIEDAFKKIDEHETSIKMDSMPYKLESRILDFYGNLNNAERSAGEIFYVFSRYEDLLPDGHSVFLKNIFSPLIEKTKRHFMYDLQELKKLNLNKQYFKYAA